MKGVEKMKLETILKKVDKLDKQTKLELAEYLVLNGSVNMKMVHSIENQLAVVEAQLV